MSKKATTETDDAKFRRVIEKAWSDQGFRERLIKDPAGVLSKEGIEPPSGVEIQVIESTPKKRYFVIPPTPDQNLTAAQVKAKSVASDYKALVHMLYNVNCC